MARTTKQPAATMVTVVEYKSTTSGIAGPYVLNRTYNAQSHGYGGDATNVTRDDIRKTPKGARRIPLRYAANGYTSTAAYVNLSFRDLTPLGYRKWDIEGFWGNAIPTALPTSAFDEGAIAAAKIKILKRIGDQKWSMGQALAESRESVSMIAKSAKTLQRALMHASRKEWTAVARVLGVKPKKLGEAANTTASGWLGYHFGWAPIVSDLAGAMVALGGIDDWKDKKLTLSASSHVERVTTSTTKYGPYDVHLNQPFTLQLTMQLPQRVRAIWQGMVTYSVTIGSLRKLMQHGMIGLSTPWAIMPASYILDWIIPVADFLAAFDATAGLSYDYGYETRFVRRSYSKPSVSYTPGSTVLRMDRFSAQVGNTGSRFTMNRTPWGGLQTPFYLKDPLDLWKAVTALSLFKVNAYNLRTSSAR